MAAVIWRFSVNLLIDFDARGLLIVTDGSRVPATVAQDSTVAI